MEEPHNATPRPCSTPHSAPIHWLKPDPAPEIAATIPEPKPAQTAPPSPEQQHRQDVDTFLDA